MTPTIVMLAGFAVVAAGDYDYEIAEYRASFEQVGGGPDVKATLEITYDVFGKPKSGGFKYVGKSVVEGLRGSDEKGAPLQVRTLQERETKLEWSFPPIEQGRKKISVEFVLKDYLYRHDGSCRLEAPWAGVFRVPVRRGRYEFVFPPGQDPDVKTIEPMYYSTETSGARKRVVASQLPLVNSGFTLDFSCTLPRSAETQRQAATRRGADSGAALIPLLIFGFVGMVVLVMYLSRKSRESGGSGGGCSVGGCGGGCGGGGCGGGGCGG